MANKITVKQIQAKSDFARALSKHEKLLSDWQKSVGINNFMAMKGPDWKRWKKGRKKQRQQARLEAKAQKRDANLKVAIKTRVII